MGLSFSNYIAYNRVPPCPKEDLNLLRQIRSSNNGKGAREQLVKNNLGLVRCYARRYIHSRRSLTFDDLVQEGCIGVLRAAETFDKRKGKSFSHWAGFWIRQMMLTAIYDTDRVVRIPRDRAEKAQKIRKLLDAAKEDGRATPTTDSIVEELGISETRARSIMQFPDIQVLSMDAPLGHENKEAKTLHGVIPAKEKENKEDHVGLKAMLKALPPDEARVIRAYYGIGTRELNHPEIARLIGTTQQRSQQILASALDRLRKMKDPKPRFPWLEDKEGLEIMLGELTLIEEQLFRKTFIAWESVDRETRGKRRALIAKMNKMYKEMQKESRA